MGQTAEVQERKGDAPDIAQLAEQRQALFKERGCSVAIAPDQHRTQAKEAPGEVPALPLPSMQGKALLHTPDRRSVVALLILYNPEVSKGAGDAPGIRQVLEQTEA